MDTAVAPHAKGSSACVKEDITQHEIAALKTRFNLADAHTHQKQSRSQRCIVESLPSLWYKAENQTQYQSEQEFIEAFYSFHGQHRALQRKDQIYLVYAASIGMHITATYLKKHNLRVGLIEPCFDNLHDLMKHMQVPMSPLSELLFRDHSAIYGNLVEHASDLDAIVLVDPNNPTGFSLFSPGPEAFMEV
ncbi:MAG TPA: aspartate aminotransferase, partial [Pseudomonas sp.]|nr:aspartate aminotransferase [Pseudomonas sp.]